MPRLKTAPKIIAKRAIKGKLPAIWLKKGSGLPDLREVDLTKTIVHEDGEEHLGIIVGANHYYLIKDREGRYDIGHFWDDYSDGGCLTFSGSNTDYSSLLDFERVWRIV